jgi:hypothetical protein
MNAHNEQQALPCPFCGREPDLSFNSVSCGCAASPFIDREDALQVWNTRAAQPSPVVKQNLTTQPAAAQEAVAEITGINGRNGVEIHWLEGPAKIGDLLYAAPVTAAPGIDLRSNMLRLAEKWERQAAEHGVRQFTGNDHLLFANELRAQIDASPKGGSEACERIAAMLHQEATDEPWTVCGVEHDGPDRAYYRELARRVLDAAQAGDAEVQP